MADIIEIQDFSLPGLAAYAHLTEAQLRNRLEPEKGIFIAESPKSSAVRWRRDAGPSPCSWSGGT